MDYRTSCLARLHMRYKQSQRKVPVGFEYTYVHKFISVFRNRIPDNVKILFDYFRTERDVNVFHYSFLFALVLLVLLLLLHARQFEMSILFARFVTFLTKIYRYMFVFYLWMHSQM